MTTASDLARSGDDSREEWRAVVGFGSELYEISSFGRTRRTETGRILKPRQKKNGYLQVCISVFGHAKNRHVHQLVALAFIGPYPLGSEINHKNHRKSDNRVGNLEYVTHAQNAREAAARGLMGRNLPGSMNPRAKLTEDEVRLMRQLFDSNAATRRQLSDRFGITWEQASNIVRRRQWKEVS